MKTHVGLIAIVFAACGTEALDTGETVQAVKPHCPDPDDCTVSNGGGVYTEELGDAGIGGNDFMITHFINTGGGVTLEGRALDETRPGYYTTQPGAVSYARLNGGGMRQVLSVGESLTVPTFMVSSPNGPIPVTGADLLNLQLVVSFEGKPWSLTFWHHSSDTGDTGATVHQFDMRWDAGEIATANATPYCSRAPINGSVADPVVFQQGIIVNPITAVTTQNDSYVTLSCRHGAVATVRWWGYVYRGNSSQADMFEAAMHMKRASYCGDETFYTRANTDILIRDTAGNQHDTLLPGGFEASWGRPWAGGPLRAVCVNLAHRRHPMALYPPDSSGEDFVGDCADNTTIPDCARGAFGSLADQLSP